MIPLTFVLAAALFSQDPDAKLDELKKQLSDDAANVRVRAVRELTRLKARETAEPIRGLLADPEWEVRYFSVLALEQFGDKDATPLLRALLQDPEATVIVAAVNTLGAWAFDAAFEDMILLLKHPKSDVRGAVVAQFSAARYGKAAKPLQELLKDPDPAILALAIRALAALPAPAAVDEIFQLALTDESDIRSAAVDAVAKLGSLEKHGRIVKASIAEGESRAHLWAILAYWGDPESLKWFPEDALSKRPLWMLNRQTAPEAVANLRSRRMDRRDLRAWTLTQILERLARTCDLKLEWSDAVPAEARAAKLQGVEPLGRQPTCETVLVATGLAWRIDGGTLKLLSHAEEVAAWKPWIAEQK